eukprot:gnl/TRDRNA2_/TRDRNA2_192694_c0_seq1.p1 gnl/TRDRNA2_/TRDRNA2_192694_c0~~gnl/TRDRNA2_/TRDRNA2_192694_c0_seq1.p1  ORF type:complete len:266 (+),score=41.93 gnl/TRDRNA2_/TRDRNA2_192694_c0_seq1:42-800(+)
MVGHSVQHKLDQASTLAPTPPPAQRQRPRQPPQEAAALAPATGSRAWRKSFNDSTSGAAVSDERLDEKLSALQRRQVAASLPEERLSALHRRIAELQAVAEKEHSISSLGQRIAELQSEVEQATGELQDRHRHAPAGAARGPTPFPVPLLPNGAPRDVSRDRYQGQNQSLFLAPTTPQDMDGPTFLVIAVVVGLQALMCMTAIGFWAMMLWRDLKSRRPQSSCGSEPPRRLAAGTQQARQSDRDGVARKKAS